MADPLTIAWILSCAFLVFLMQAGFLCLESGLVRAKNSINVASKNLLDLCISGLVFWLFGYALMFGASLNGWFGTSDFLFNRADDPWNLSFFFFQAMFCSTAATIVAGAVAERMRFLAYGLTAFLMSAFVYPISGHWAWGGAASGGADGWLARLGFIDFAGSSVVHSVGGWVALAAVLVVGARIGRFASPTDDGSDPADARAASSARRSGAIPGSNIPLSALGVVLLWFGWFGFNGGSTLALDDRVPLVLLNTLLAGAAGGLAALLFSYRVKRHLAVVDLLNGIIGGLVGITASCHLQMPPFAVLIGAIAGLIAAAGAIWLERLRIDDAVGAIPAHLFAGIWGTLAVALFAPAGAFASSGGRWRQLAVQIVGILAIGLYSFALSWLSLSLINRVYRLRVDEQSERLGLNISEHAASTEIFDLLTEMDQQRRRGDFSQPVHSEPHTEVGQIARQYNEVLQRVGDEMRKREQLLRELSASETRKSAILDAVLDCIVTIDARGHVLEFNPAAERTFCCSQRAAIGRSLAEIAIAPEQRSLFEQALKSGFAREGRYLLNQRNQVILQRADHETFPAELAITRVRDGRDLEYNLHIRDITRQRELQRRLHQLAHYDVLTGLANRNHFRQSLGYHLTTTTDAARAVAVLFLDLDRFKTINDSMGHAAGDQLLRSVAERLRQWTRNTDLVARWGGDEFLVALFGVEHVSEATHKANQLVEVLGVTHVLDGKPVLAPSSIGIALYPDGGETADLLIRNADLALYEAKNTGRNNYQLFSPALAQRLADRFDCEKDLRGALAGGELLLYYQPQFAIGGDACIGVEALLRWQHPVKGLIQPNVFIPILEESGLIDTVGEWVIRAACRQMRTWRQAGLDVPRIAVNVSGRQFLKPDFVQSVATILREEEMPAAALELEITETVLARDNAQCIDVLARLNALGLEIAIDDFGTGYSSLSYLKRFPIDTIKLDRSFVSECDHNPEDAAICAAIISLARSLDLKTIAEGVERPEQLEYLRNEGCRAYQGYLASRPLPAAELVSFLLDRRTIHLMEI